MRRVVALSLLACSSPSKPHPAVANQGAGYPWFDRVDLVVVENGQLVAYDLGPGPTELARLALPQDGPFVGGDWASRDHLFVRVAERRVFQLSRHGLVELAIPPAARFAAPRPQVDNAEDLTAGGPGTIGEDGGLVVTGKAALWAECPWGFVADRFHCEGWRVAQLWPTAQAVAHAELPPRVDHAFGFPDERPADAHLETATKGLACRLGDKSSWIDAASVRELTLPEPPPDDAEDVVAERAWEVHEDSAVLGAHWLGKAPPRLLVRWGSPGFDSYVEYAWSIHDGCRLEPIAKGRLPRPGPVPYWLDHGKQVDLRRGTERILTLPSASTVFFRPR